MSSLLTLAKQHRHEEEIKRSRFIAVAQRADSPEEAMERVEAMSDPEANHNCWAYKVGDRYRFSDDGEPGGSAGRPILAAIEGQGIDCVAVVVIRFFGGTKLGVGGLVRAYGGTAAECLRTAPKHEVVSTICLNLTIPFDSIGAIYPIMERLSATKISETYEAVGLVLTVELAETNQDTFITSIRDATRGAAQIELI